MTLAPILSWMTSFATILLCVGREMALFVASPQKQYRMLNYILTFYDRANAALDAGSELSQILALPVRDRIGRAKYIPEDDAAQFDAIDQELLGQMAELSSEGGL